MPLIVLGLIVIAGIVIYALVRYANSDDEPVDLRPVRERYSHVFEKMKENMNRGANYEVVDDDEDETEGSSTKSDGNTMFFPDDAEVEKRKRNIH